MSDSLAQLSMLMNPGVTARPCAVDFDPAADVGEGADGGDRIGIDGEVRDDGRSAAAIVDGPAPDHDIVVGGGRASANR